MVGSAAAVNGRTDFETPFSTTWRHRTTGSVNGQDGWHSLSVPPHLTKGYDQEVVDNATYGGQNPETADLVPSFGAQSLRVSNCGDRGLWRVRVSDVLRPVANPAGEAQDNTVFYGTFDFIPTSADYQPGLQISVSPDNGSGGRMSFVGLKDTQDGIFIRFFETDADAVIVAHVVGTYDRDEVHTIQFLIEFVP